METKISFKITDTIATKTSTGTIDTTIFSKEVGSSAVFVGQIHETYYRLSSGDIVSIKVFGSEKVVNGNNSNLMVKCSCKDCSSVSTPSHSKEPTIVNFQQPQSISVSAPSPPQPTIVSMPQVSATPASVYISHS